MRALFLGILLIYSVITASIFAQSPATSAATQPEMPPSLDLQDLKGGKHTLQEYKGKVVLLNFWATWCVPCATEMPMLNEMQRHYKDKLLIIAASIDDPQDYPKLQPFLHKHKAGDLTVMTGASLDTLDLFHMGSALPGSVFIDENGQIVARSEGALKRPELTKRLTEMTGIAEPKIAATPAKPKASAKKSTGEK
jgi:thiol-disulfide isomerase/thioredoxin